MQQIPLSGERKDVVDRWISGVRIAAQRQLQTRRGSFNLVRPNPQDGSLLQQDLVENDDE